MHELAIAQSVVNLIREHVPDKQASLVRAVRIRVGRLSGVFPQSLDFCFGAIVGGTSLQSARLEVEEISTVSVCEDCTRSFESDRGVLVCPFCGGTNASLTSGTELEVVEIEIEDRDSEGL